MDRWQRRFNQGNSRPNSRRRRSAEATPEQPPQPIEGIDYIYNPLAGRAADGPFKYDVYGQHAPTEAKPLDAVEDDAGLNQLFQSMAIDPEAKLDDFRIRDYSPTLAAWAQDEPLAYVDGLNAYVMFGDESGAPLNPLEGTEEAAAQAT